MIKRYTKKATTWIRQNPEFSLWSLPVLFAAIVAFTPLSKFFVGLIIGGMIPGSSTIVPSWVMMLIYATITLTLLTYILEEIHASKQAMKRHLERKERARKAAETRRRNALEQNTAKRRPRRRYSHA